ARGGGEDERADRGPPLHQPEDRGQPPDAPHGQARHPLDGRARPLRRAAEADSLVWWFRNTMTFVGSAEGSYPRRRDERRSRPYAQERRLGDDPSPPQPEGRLAIQAPGANVIVFLNHHTRTENR